MGRSHKPAQRLTRCPSSAPLGRNPRTRTHHPRRGRLGQIFTCAKDCTASVRSRRLDDAAAAHPIWHRSGQKSRLRAPRAVLQSGARVSSGETDRRASPPSRGRGRLRHLAFHTRFRRARALYGPAREREPLQAMAELKPEKRSLTNIDRKKGYRKTTDAGSTGQRLDVSRGIIQLGRPHSFRNRAVGAHLRR